METHLGQGTYKFLFLYEFIGTAFILFALNVSGGNPVAVVFTVFAMILMAGPITGAHFNPAVSLGVLLCSLEIMLNIPVFLLTISA